MAAGTGLAFTSLNGEVSIDALPVDGTMPDWLEGSLLRNGPGRFEVGNEGYRHWFDGLAMLHRFTLANGRVSYANRFLHSPAWLAAQRTGRIARAEFDTDPQCSFFERIAMMFGDGNSDNANVNIVPYGGGYLALTETPSPVSFDGTTLETLGVLHYDDKLAGQVTTAHTHHDPQRRATFNIVIEFGRASRYKVVRIDDGTLVRTPIAAIPVKEPAYVHAFSTTGRYVVIAEYPLVVRPLTLMLHPKPFIENYRWEPGRAARWYVVDKDGRGLVATYDAPAFFAFHHVNAFDDGDAVVVDVSAYDDASIIDSFLLANLRDPQAPPLPRAELRRYRLIPGHSSAEIETLTGVSTELPRIAPASAATAYRYAYGVNVSAQRPREFINELVKVDVVNRTVASWSQPDAYPGEPVFAARPGGSDEDDGVLLSVVLDAAAGNSFLLVLDARTLEERARAAVPHHIPFGFHGIYAAA